MTDQTRACCDTCGLAYDLDEHGVPMTQAAYTCDDCGGYVDDCLTATTVAREADRTVERLAAGPPVTVANLDQVTRDAVASIGAVLLAEAVDRVTRHLDARDQLRTVAGGIIDAQVIEQVNPDGKGFHQLQVDDLRRILAAFDA
jgi:hypothetical protein